MSPSTEIPLAGARKPGRGNVVEVHLQRPSAKAQALSGNLWATDPVGVELAASMMNGTSATTLLSSALYRDIPL